MCSPAYANVAIACKLLPTRPKIKEQNQWVKHGPCGLRLNATKQGNGIVRVGIQEIEAAQSVSRRRLEDLFQSMLHRAFNGEV
jgi:hypothetical protein